MAETNLAQAVEAANDFSSYDTNIKLLLADKQILARILKYAVQEFKEMAVSDIMFSIGDDIDIGIKPLDAGLSNLGRINLSNTEDNVPGEGKIFFDIRFSAYHREMEMKFLVNVEAQRSIAPSKLGYHLENRIIFYLARMISAQKQTEFFDSDFDSIKKVRSIWICMDNGEDGDSIEEINLDRNTVFGNKVSTHNIDLMKGIIINVRSGNYTKDSQNTLISMLEKLFSQTSVDEKKRILTEKYGMIMTTELEGRLQTMCNLSENIKDQSIKMERINAIERMINAGFAKEQIILCGYTEEEFTKAESLLCTNA
ncbi:MAG: hypothetical protein K2I96_17355 [Lachnospiraceae bacterium]|nr:hypothetical protein [Lachnospiraceae bacterium]